MIYKGYKFRKSRTVVSMPNLDSEKKNYVAFGKVYKEGQAPASAIQTQYQWPSRSPVYAKYIPLSGHSLTNMAYGKDGRIYLMLDGKFYTAKMKG